MTQQFQYTKLEAKDHFLVNIRKDRINDGSNPKVNSTLRTIDNGSRISTVQSIEQLMEYTREFFEYLNPGDLGIVIDVNNNITRMFVWMDRNIKWKEITGATEGGSVGNPTDHAHSNMNVLNFLSQNVAGQLLYKGELIQGSAGIKDLSGFNTSNLADSPNKRYILDNQLEFIEMLKTKINSGTTVGNMQKSTYDTNNDGIVDQAATLHGLKATVENLNALTGIQSNVQQQIDSMQRGMVFRGIVNTRAQVATSFPTPSTGDTVIVAVDETRNNARTFYTHDGEQWIYLGLFTVSVRNFSTHPINLSTETTGVLPQSSIDPLIMRKSESHTHANADLLNSYNQTNANLADAVAKKHNHSNKAALDGTQESFTTELKNKIHDQNMVGSKAVNESSIGNGKVLAYNSISGQLEYVTAPTGSGGGGSASIDDSTISTTSTWSSQKINNDIQALEDTVDGIQKGERPFGAPNWTPETFYEVNNIVVSNGRLYRALLNHTSSVVFSDDMLPWNTRWESLVGSSGAGVQAQVTKLGITGTQESPHITSITIARTNDFNLPRINVLKFKPGANNIVSTIAEFTNSEASDFIANPSVEYNGKMFLKTDYEYPTIDEGQFGTSRLYSAVVDHSSFKAIDDISITSDYSKFNIKAVPNDTLIMPTKDIRLSNVSNYDLFNITATQSGAGIIKIIVSADSGATWKTYNNGWQDINPTTNDVKNNGISIAVLNGLTTQWNDLITQESIRFAYLLSIENSTTDVAFTDKLNTQYDAQGSWLQAKDVDYDVTYISNQQVEVKLYFSGDAKINYIG